MLPNFFHHLLMQLCQQGVCSIPQRSYKLHMVPWGKGTFVPLPQDKPLGPPVPMPGILLVQAQVDPGSRSRPGEKIGYPQCLLPCLKLSFSPSKLLPVSLPHHFPPTSTFHSLPLWSNGTRVHGRNVIMSLQPLVAARQLHEMACHYLWQP